MDQDSARRRGNLENARSRRYQHHHRREIQKGTAVSGWKSVFKVCNPNIDNRYDRYIYGLYPHRNGITRYEEIFGKTWVSVGGETTTREFLQLIDLKPGMKVLDIGSGAGGSAFYMARQ